MRCQLAPNVRSEGSIFKSVDIAYIFSISFYILEAQIRWGICLRRCHSERSRRISSLGIRKESRFFDHAQNDK